MAVIFIHCQQVRIVVLIADHEQLLTEQDRRSAHAVQVGKWPQWTFPALFSIRTIRSQSEVSEEYVHVLTVGDRAGRGRMVQFVQHLGTVRQDLAAPENLAAGAIEAEREQVIAFGGRQEDAVASQRGRRLSRWQGRFPDYVLIGAQLSREFRLLRHARAVRPAKLGPVGGGEQWECGKEGYKESDHRQPHYTIRDRVGQGHPAPHGPKALCREKS